MFRILLDLNLLIKKGISDFDSGLLPFNIFKFSDSDNHSIFIRLFVGELQNNNAITAKVKTVALKKTSLV